MALNMIFNKANDAGTKTLTLDNPVAGLKKSQVQAVMQEMVEKKALDTSSYTIASVGDCYLKDSVVTQLAE